MNDPQKAIALVLRDLQNGTISVEQAAAHALWQGERQALLSLRSFIARNGVKQVDQYAAERLHDIRMDAPEYVGR